MKNRNNCTSFFHFAWKTLAIISMFMLMLPNIPASAATPEPASVTLVGSLQSELGCPGDWQADCTLTHLVYDTNDDVWQQTFSSVPSGFWEYKAALDDSWDENYGLGGVQGGPNIPLNLTETADVKFYYDHKSNWITDNKSSIIATVPGSYQDEMGCSGDWDAGCLRSWLQNKDGDGIYSFSTTSIPAGSYEAKVTINESWDENYGEGGAQNGSNIPFEVTQDNSTVTFTYDSSSHILTIQVIAPQPALDNEIWWDGLRHDSRDPLYRNPGGAVPADTPVTLRFRTYHNDVSSVKVRLYDINTAAQTIKSMSLAASDVSCYQDLWDYTCDFWEITLPNTAVNNFWYRFIITDGTKKVYYADNTPALDGGLGAPSDTVIDNSYALMVYKPDFSTPNWAKNAVIYQIFPDRFRSGRSDNDPKTGDIRYNIPVLKLPWGTLPEGYCRNYADADTVTCPWRFGVPAGEDPESKEGPMGRDYMGGDLKGVDQKLDYLVSLGVNTIYFNPIFDSGSNHGYDTQNYLKIDPYFGTQKDFDNLVKHAKQHNVHIILDGVYNHMSSDSAFFDRYHHYSTIGACESLSSPYRSWFTFHDVAAGTGTCVGSAGANSATYDGWFGFDSIPVLTKTNAQVKAYFLTNTNSVTRYWLAKGAGGWRMDVMGDSSFPSGYWESFRTIVKNKKADALIVGELWQKDSTLLRLLRGETADTTMNYRLRDAVIGLLTPGNFDSKGFADSGRVLNMSEFAERMSSIREDYPDPAYFTLMNLLDSHDTVRLLWALTPGENTRADKEDNAENLATGKQQQMIASLIQFTIPGAPTIYYGDEVGVTGGDDPDDRRTYPWADKGGSPDMDLFAHYQTLASLRKQNNVLTQGDFRILLADDDAETVAFGRKTTSQAAIVAVNRSYETRGVDIPVSGFVPDGFTFNPLYTVGNSGDTAVTSSNGFVSLELAPRSAWLLATGNVDFLPPDAPTGLAIQEASELLTMTWDASAGATGYNIYRSPFSDNGWVKLNADPLTDAYYEDSTVENTRQYYYAVTALDDTGNESDFSQSAGGIPHMTIGWANLQWPYSITHEISIINRTNTIYGQVWIDGATNQPGPTPGLIAQVGFGPDGSNPAGNSDWIWVTAVFNVDAGNNDEFMASLLPESVGGFDYVYRYSLTGGRDWLYADLNGPVPTGETPANPGDLQVIASSDTTPPETPANLHVVSASPSGIELAWDEIIGDPTLYGYEVLRSDASGGPYITLAVVTAAPYIDLAVTESQTYYYIVRAVDTAFNYSGDSNETTGTAELRKVSVTFNVTIPATTDPAASVYIAGTLDRLDGGLPAWNPGGVVMTQVDATHWAIILTGNEAVQIEYKYTLGTWDNVEKDVSCGEIGNRQLTLDYGVDGTMTVNDVVLNWRNVAPCGD